MPVATPPAPGNACLSIPANSVAKSIIGKQARASQHQKGAGLEPQKGFPPVDVGVGDGGRAAPPPVWMWAWGIGGDFDVDVDPF